MAVYTKINKKDISSINKKFEIEKIINFKGIKQGIENTKAQQDFTKTSTAGATFFFAVLYGSIIAGLLEAVWVIWDPDAC